MSTYSEASQFKQMLAGIIDERIRNHPEVQSAIKARKAIVWDNPDTNKKTVKVKFLPDIFNPNVEPLEFPYNSQMQSYLSQATPQETTVSVWYNYSLNNGVVMQDSEWTK